MTARERDYVFHSFTRALCGTCLALVDAKVLLREHGVFLAKRCPTHGTQEVMLANDVAYWRRAREHFLKPAERVLHHNTPIARGCPFDCGICPDHEQHGCLSLLEITDACNLSCPTCYASSGPHRADAHRSRRTITAMLDRIVSNEGEPDVVQISGGEPTLHPEFFGVLDECKTRPIRHLMLNTNGIRIAKEDGFAERLAGYAPRFEVYLQFDSLDDRALRTLRGASLADIRLRALERLNALNLSTTLVVTARRGTNDHALGDILRFALEQRCVRGVTIQPVQDAGRNDGFSEPEHRLTLTEVRQRVLEQFPTFAPEDIVPVPCHPDCIAMAYGIRGPQSTLEPLTRYVPPHVLVEGARNTISFESDERMRRALFAALSTAHGPESAGAALRDLLCCLPGVSLPSNVGYDRVFRLILLQFLDRHTLDLYSVRKSCVHIAHPDGRRVIPFDTYNVLYRDGLEPQRARSTLPVVS